MGWMKPLALGAIMALTAGVAQADSWGAVMFGPNGAHGYAYGQKSAQDAYDVAQKACKRRCTEYKTFANTCAAMAEGSGGQWGWGYADSKDQARANALSACSNSASGCQIRVWACSR